MDRPALLRPRVAEVAHEALRPRAAVAARGVRRHVRLSGAGAQASNPVGTGTRKEEQSLRKWGGPVGVRPLFWSPFLVLTARCQQPIHHGCRAAKHFGLQSLVKGKAHRLDITAGRMIERDRLAYF